MEFIDDKYVNNEDDQENLELVQWYDEGTTQKLDNFLFSVFSFKIVKKPFHFFFKNPKSK